MAAAQKAQCTSATSSDGEKLWFPWTVFYRQIIFPSSSSETESNRDAFKGWAVNKIKQPTELNWLETRGLMTACEAFPPSIHGRTRNLYTREERPEISTCDKLRWPGWHLRHSDSAREELKSSQVSTSIWQNEGGGLWCTLGSSFAFAYCSSLFSLPRN